MPFHKGQKIRLGKKWSEKSREKRRGVGNPVFGKHWKLSEETRKKMSISQKNRKRLPLTQKWRDKISEGMKGKNKGEKNPMWGKCKELNHRWKGGRTSLEQRIRTNFKYRQWRSDVFTRDNYTCQFCYKRGVYLEAHHIKKYSVILDENNIKTLEEALFCEELWNINNGLTLCRKCHDRTKIKGFQIT